MTYLSQQKKLVKKLEESFSGKTPKTTVVEMQGDYLKDNKICLTSVVFIPEEISEIIVKKIIEPLKKIEPYHYFYPPESLHLTIKNVRTIHKPKLFTSTDVEKVNKAFAEVIPEFPAYNFSIEDVIIFPTSLSIAAYADEMHQTLVLALDKKLKEIGVPDNKKYISDSIFFGNISICRFVKTPGEKFMNEAKKLRHLKIGKITAETVNLITCNASCSPKTKHVIAGYKLK